MFSTLRDSRHELEAANEKELLAVHEQHEAEKLAICEKQRKEIRDLERGHLDKITKLHEKFEHELEKVLTLLPEGASVCPGPPYIKNLYPVLLVSGLS